MGDSEGPSNSTRRDAEIEEIESRYKRAFDESQRATRTRQEQILQRLTAQTSHHEAELARVQEFIASEKRSMEESFRAQLETERQKFSYLQTDSSRRLAEAEETRRQQTASLREDMEGLKRNQERAMHEFKIEYERVCELLRLDGLKFEEAVKQTETDYESEISRLRRGQQSALQTESEKATNALKESLAMKHTLSHLQQHLKVKNEEIDGVKAKLAEVNGKLAAAETANKSLTAVIETKKQEYKGLAEKMDGVIQENKHLNAYRFVLFEKVKDLENEKNVLAGQITDLQQDVKAMYSEISDEAKAKRNTNVHLQERQLRVKALETELSQARRELTAAKRAVETFKKDLVYILTTEQDKIQVHTKLHLQKLAQDIQDVQEGGALADPPSLVKEILKQRDHLLKQVETGSKVHRFLEETNHYNKARLIEHNASLISELNLQREENKGLVTEVAKLRGKLRSYQASEDNEKKALPVAGKSAKSSKLTPFQKRELERDLQIHTQEEGFNFFSDSDFDFQRLHDGVKLRLEMEPSEEQLPHESTQAPPHNLDISEEMTIYVGGPINPTNIFPAMRKPTVLKRHN